MLWQVANSAIPGRNSSKLPLDLDEIIDKPVYTFYGSLFGLKTFNKNFSQFHFMLRRKFARSVT
jgi:hypothetical protein